MFFKHQIFTNNTPQMATPSNTLGKMLAADLSVCLSGLPLCSRAGESGGSMYSGQREEGNVTVFVFAFVFKKSHFQIELGLVKLFSFPPDCCHPTTVPLNQLPLTALPAKCPSPEGPPAASQGQCTHFLGQHKPRAWTHTALY